MSRITSASAIGQRRGMVIATLFAGMMLSSNAFKANAQARAVFTSTNSPAANSVVMFDRAGNGTLTPIGTYFTGGTGTGGGLGNQGALVLSSTGKWLFVINAGSDEISVFNVRQSGLVLVNKVWSGGVKPNSLTVHGNILYVLNSGAPNNITGFTISDQGALTPIPGSTQSLSAPSTGPAQVGATSSWKITDGACQ